MNRSCSKNALSVASVVLVATTLTACASTKVAMRSCDLDHPYHQLSESAPVVAPEGLEAPRAARTYQLPEQEKLASQPERFLTPGDVARLENKEAEVSDCLIHPPTYATPVEVNEAELEAIKAPRKQRRLPSTEDDDTIGRGGSRMKQGSGYPQ